MNQGYSITRAFRARYAGQAKKAVNRDTAGTLLGWLFFASALLFFSAITAGTALAKCGRSQKKGTTRGRALAPPLKVPLF